MLAVVVLSVLLGFSCVAAKPDLLVDEGLTGRIRHEKWSMHGYKSRKLLLAQSLAEISTPARRLLQMESPSRLSQPQGLLGAAKTGDLETVKREVEGGADVEMRDPENDATPLIFASGNGHTDIMLFLLQEGADIDAGGTKDRTPLYYAAWVGEAEAVEILIDQGADLDKADSDGFTPLIRATREGYDDIVAALINAGADIEAATDAGATPLILAAHDGQFNVARELISAGADVNARAEKDITPLHFAARLSGGSRFLTALLDAGANVDAQAVGGRTALHFAADLGQKRNIETLLDAGADTTLRTESSTGLGSTAEDVICDCMDVLDDDDIHPDIKALCDVNACSDIDDILALFD